MSKRERQKKRREAKLAEERAVEAKSRRNRMIGIGLLVVVFLGLIGAAVAKNRADNAAKAAREAAVLARLDELGCTPDEEQEDRGQGHLDSANLAASAPEVIYPSRPATSGEHFNGWLKTGVYEQDIDERVLIHNMEHGYVIAYYDEDAEESQVEELKTFAQTQIDGDFPKLIVAPWIGELPEDKNFAFGAWSRRQMCEDFDDETLAVFLERYHSGSGVAPEKTLPAHLEEGNGTIDPGTDPFLLPPLGTQAVPTEGMSEGTQGQNTEGAEPGEAATEASGATEATS